MRVLIFGGSGQVGRSLQEAGQKRGWQTVAPSHAETNICDRSAVADCVRRHVPAAVVNLAGYTAVDDAEAESDQAFAVNLDGARIVAEAAAENGLPLLHLSTDYVFDGRSVVPYVESDPVNPFGVYAKSKEAGERAVRAATSRHIILRTSWVYSPFGSNFVRTMLQIAAEGRELAVVNDQTGSPTSAADLAAAMAQILSVTTVPGVDAWGTYHYAGRDEVTWYDFACAIFDGAKRFGIRPAQLRAVATDEFPRPAPRPSYSVLSTAKLERTFGIRSRPLRDSLMECLIRLFPGSTRLNSSLVSE